MPITMLGSLALYWAIMSVTPGPNNILLASSGLRFGIRRTWPQLIGIQFGVMVQLGAVAAGLGAVFATQAWLQLALKVFGTLYLLWLAWHFWQAAEMGDQSLAKPLGFIGAAGFQFVNPKAWLGSLAAVAAFATPGTGYWTAILWIVLFVILVGTPAGLVWVLFGAALRAWLGVGHRTIVINRCFAVLTALTAILFWLPHTA